MYSIGHPCYRGANAYDVHWSLCGLFAALVDRDVDPKVAREACKKAEAGSHVTLYNNAREIIECKKGK